jgi:outer membrane receptor for ferrienterochelin and colicin
MKNLLLLLFLSFTFQQSVVAQKTISGYVSAANSGEPLIGASIYDFISGKGTTTNAYGFFSITLAGDSAKLRISFVGHTSEFIPLALNQNHQLKVELKDVNELKEVTITANEGQKIEENSQMSTIDVSMEKVKSLPVFLGEQDVLKTIQLLPGVQSGSEGASGIYVRGGGPDQNLILLDGVPVYNATHLFGFFSVFNADAINSVQLIKGGFPAQYGGRLSSVIDIRMKEGNMKKIKGEGSVGMISSKIMLEGPIKSDKTSFAVSARRTYIDMLARPIILAASNGQGVGGYYFYDMNAKLNHKFSDKSRLYLSGYMGNDKFYLTSIDTYVSNGNTHKETFQTGLQWGNAIAALRWNYLITPKLFSNTTLTFSRYRFNTGLSFEEEISGNGPTVNNKFAYDYISGIRDYSAKVDFDYTPHPDHYIKFGTGYTFHTFTPGVNQFQINDGGQALVDTTFGSETIYAHEYWGYIGDDFKINDRLKTNIGLHISGFSVQGKTYGAIQPRFSGRYLVNEKSSVKLSYAHMAQYLHLLTNAGIGLPTDLWLPPTENIKPQLSHQVAAGYAQTVRKKFELSVEAYYKTMANLIEYKDGASFLGNAENWENKVEVGKGWAYGAEFLFEKKIGKTSGWIGYTLAWSNRQFENLNFGQPFPYKYDRRNDIGIAVTHKFNERVDIGIVWVYGTGNAVTLGTERYLSYSAVNYTNSFYSPYELEHIESRNNYRMKSYHRLDIGVNLHKETRFGERTWSLGLYNAYSRQNPFFLYFSNDDLGNRRLTQVSLFPIIPSLSYSFKF